MQSDFFDLATEPATDVLPPPARTRTPGVPDIAPAVPGLYITKPREGRRWISWLSEWIGVLEMVPDLEGRWTSRVITAEGTLELGVTQPLQVEPASTALLSKWHQIRGLSL